jgi:hypothetical protein
VTGSGIPLSGEKPETEKLTGKIDECHHSISTVLEYAFEYVLYCTRSQQIPLAVERR